MFFLLGFPPFIIFPDERLVSLHISLLFEFNFLYCFDNPYILQLTYKPFDAFLCKKFKMQQSCRLGFIIILFFGTFIFFIFFLITPSSSNSPTKPFEAFLCKKFKMQQSCRLGYRFFFLFFGFIILFFWDFYNFFFLLNSGSPKFFAL